MFCDSGLLSIYFDLMLVLNLFAYNVRRAINMVGVKL